MLRLINARRCCINWGYWAIATASRTIPLCYAAFGVALLVALLVAPLGEGALVLAVDASEGGNPGSAADQTLLAKGSSVGCCCRSSEANRTERLRGGGIGLVGNTKPLSIVLLAFAFGNGAGK